MALTQKQRKFVEEYLTCWCGAEAARRAGYSARGHSAWTLGCRQLKRDDVQALIRQRIAEKAMTADEVLLRLAEQARGEQAAYLRDNGTVDLERLLADGKGHLVKGTKWTQRGDLVVEFYDAQRALELLGRHLGLLKDQVEHSGEVGIFDLTEWERQRAERRTELDALDDVDGYAVTDK